MGAIVGIMLSSIFNTISRNQSVSYPAVKYLHRACRSNNQNELKAYQSKVDNLPNEDLIYVRTKIRVTVDFIFSLSKF
jgi:hypothetical protein